jgi:hypothetical protein
MTQCERLLSRLERGPVHPMAAWDELGIYRLSARICDLRDAGHKIISESINVCNRFGEACRVASYRLEK